jgi:predicted nucleotidyltransferase
MGNALEEQILDQYKVTIENLRKDFVEACKSVFGENLVSIITKGSTVKGGFIPGISDVDMHIYLKEEAFEHRDYLTLELGLKLQEKINDLLHRYDIGGSPIQVIPINVSMPKFWSRSLSGTYIFLYGDECPEPEPEAEKMLEDDILNLQYQYPNYAYSLVNSYADKGNEELHQFVRRLNPAVTPTFNRVFSALTKDPFKAWKMTKFEVLDALEQLEDESAKCLAQLGREFYEMAKQWDRVKTEPEFCRNMIRVGFKIIDLGKQIGMQNSYPKTK